MYLYCGGRKEEENEGNTITTPINKFGMGPGRWIDTHAAHEMKKMPVELRIALIVS